MLSMYFGVHFAVMSTIFQLRYKFVCTPTAPLSGSLSHTFAYTQFDQTTNTQRQNACNYLMVLICCGDRQMNNKQKTTELLSMTWRKFVTVEKCSSINFQTKNNKNDDDDDDEQQPQKIRQKQTKFLKLTINCRTQNKCGKITIRIDRILHVVYRQEMFALNIHTFIIMQVRQVH